VCVCVRACVCVYVRERETERTREKETERDRVLQIVKSAGKMGRVGRDVANAYGEAVSVELPAM